jgi:serine/threonine protein kinase
MIDLSSFDPAPSSDLPPSRDNANVNNKWLLSTFRSLCARARRPERFRAIRQELIDRGFIPGQSSRHPPRPGSPFSQVYTSLEVIGEGGYGRVSKVQNMIDGQVYALKVIEVSQEDVSSAVQEVQCLARFTSPRVVRYYTSWLTEDAGKLSLFIQMEHVRGALLCDYLSGRTSIEIPHTFNLIRELATALSEIHCAGIVHRDFHPGNVILRETGGICIIDFGISSFCEKAIPIPLPQRVGSVEIRPLDRLCIAAAERPMTLRAVGTAVYASPRQLSGHKSGPPDDIYSFGITIFEMLSLFKTQMERIKAIQDLRKHRIVPDSFRVQFAEAAKLVLAMTEQKQRSRPTAADILQSDLLNDYQYR